VYRLPEDLHIFTGGAALESYPPVQTRPVQSSSHVLRMETRVLLIRESAAYAARWVKSTGSGRASIALAQRHQGTHLIAVDLVHRDLILNFITRVHDGRVIFFPEFAGDLRKGAIGKLGC